jgi:hypothetical protein
MFRRRRPLMRAAMVGGAGYAVGKRMERGREEDAYRDERIDELEQQQDAAYAAPPPSAGGMSQDAIDQLKQLADLNKQGILTDEEFAAQKAKILGG